MEKQIVKAFIVTIIFLVVYHFFMGKFMPPPAVPALDKSTKTIGSPLRDNLVTSVNSFLQNDTVELPKVELGDFIVTYSPRGGYIKEVYLKKYKEELKYKNIGFIKNHTETKFTSEVFSDKIVFRADGGRRKEFIFDGTVLKINISLLQPDMVLLFSNSLHKSMLDQRYQEFFYSQQDSLVRAPWKKLKEGSYNNIKFAGARDRYFCAALLPGMYQEISWRKIDNDTVGLFISSQEQKISLYLGPQSREYLQPLDLQGVVSYGFFHGISIWVIKALKFFYFLTKNWGISLILLSFFVYLLLFPFTMQSTKSIKRMQDVQPEIEELKKKHKDNPQKLNKEIMELYKKYKMNPLGGCLPMLFQFPVFIGLYQVLFRCVELKGASFLWINDLSLPDKLFSFPFTIPLVNISAFNLLPILIMVVSLIQQKYTSAAAAEQKKMGLFFAVFMGIIFYNFPASLVLYWFIQNSLTLLYQIHISRK